MAVTIEMGGAPRLLSLDFNAEIALAESAGTDVGALLQRFHSPELAKATLAVNAERAKLTRLLVWAALQTSTDGAVKLSEVGSWINARNVAEVMAALAAAVREAYGTAQEFDGQLAPFVPTPPAVVEAMVRMANVPGDGVVVDLGAGDGRLLVAARKAVPSCSAVGFEAHEGRAEGLRALAGLTVQQMKIQDAIESRQQILQVADVVFLYLLDSSNLAIRDGLRSVMKPGARIVSHDFAMGDWEPSAAETVFADDRTHKVYRWVV